MLSRQRLVVLAAAAGASFGAATASGQVLELVIKNTDAVPSIGGAAWAATNMFQSPSIDGSGNVAFRGSLLVAGSVTTSNNTTLYYGAPSALGLAARTGFAAPGLVDGTIVSAFQSQSVPISPNGNIWFGASTTGQPAPFGSGYLATGPANSLTAVARRGETIGALPALNSNPGQAGSNPNVNNAGQAAFYTDLVGGTGAVWVGNSANRQVAYQSGNNYAGLPAGTTVRGPISGFIINGSGTLLSGTQLTSGVGGISDANNEVLHTLPFGGSTFTTIAREGDAAPSSGGATYLRGLFSGPPLNLENQAFFFGAGNFNNEGHAVYSAGLEGTGVDASNNAGLYVYDGSTPNLLRRRGASTTAVTGATLAITSDQAFRARLNNNDQIAWTASLTQGVGGVTGTSDAVLLRTILGDSSDALVAREGDGVPVLPGALWGTSFSNLMQNNAGQLVFSTTLLDDASTSVNDITTANDLALFAWDPTAGFMMIAREGDDLSSIGINMTLNSNWLSMNNTANNEGGANALTDNGWLTFRVSGTPLAGSTDSTAIVRTMIPAPGTAMGLLIGGAAVLRRRRR